MNLAASPAAAILERRPRTAALVNLGCKVNQAELAMAADALRAAGVEMVTPDQAADLYLVNTCAVTTVAEAKSRAAVRRARRANPEATVVVTGCSVQVSRQAYASLDPRAILVDNAAKEGFLRDLAAFLEADRAGTLLHRPLPTLSGADPAGGEEGSAVPERTRAFVKVQDGCSFFCTYCIIPRARGPERSRPPEAVLADVERAVAAGRREVVLTGVNLGTYDGGASVRGRRGAHAWSALTLAGLVERILAETPIERLRLSSIEPQHVDDELLAVWRAGAPRTLPHFHLPLQSGDDGILRRMGRRYDSGFYARLVDRIRGVLPEAAIHADVMTGFPGEDEAAHQRTLALVDGLDLAGLHVFRYSPRPGTAAIRMVGAVDEGTKRRRAGELLALADRLRRRFAARQVGRQLEVLLEARLADGRWIGHAENYVGVVVAAPGELENVIARVAVEGPDPDVPERVTGRMVELVAPPAARGGGAAPALAGRAQGGG